MPTTDQILGLTNIRQGYQTSKLTNWIKKFIASPSTAVIAWNGDSTSDLAGNAISTIGLFSVASALGALLDGFNTNNLLNFGSTGNTISNLVNNNIAQPGMTIQDVINASPDLIVFSYGINDIRQNQLTVSQLQALIVRAINKYRLALPNTDIILRMPNSFKAATANTYVQQGGYGSIALAAQAQSDILYNAYYNLINYWDNVVVFDSQDLVYGRTCLASNPNMSDDIHPIYTPMVNRMINDLIGYRKPFNATFAATALSQSYATPWTVYSRALEDTTHYKVVTTGLLNSVINTPGVSFDIKFPNADGYKCRKILPGDIVNIGDSVFFKIVNGVTQLLQTHSDLRIFSTATLACPNINAVLTVYRSIYNNTQACEDYYNQRDLYLYIRRVIITASGTNTFDIGTAIDDDSLTTPLFTPFKKPSTYVVTVADTIIVDGQAPQILTGATFASNGNALRVTLAGTWTQYVGLTAYIFGNHDHE